VRTGLALVQLPGRFQIIPGQPALVLDVAHNPHAVAALAANLDAMGFFPRTHAVFGAMADKDIGAMFRLIGPLVDHWHFTDLPGPRAAAAAQLAQLWQAQAHGTQTAVSLHDSPIKALEAASASADPADRILVFGSFLTVGAVIEAGWPRSGAKHLSN
jgi:dihydrofolate synthase/folylpolyglutamate synthase